jgi:hypothetical protein
MACAGFAAEPFPARHPAPALASIPAPCPLRGRLSNHISARDGQSQPCHFAALDKPSAVAATVTEYTSRHRIVKHAPLTLRVIALSPTEW